MGRKPKKKNLSVLVITCALVLFGNKAIPEYIPVPAEKSDSNYYEETSIMQLRSRGQYGRYITFAGKTKSNSYVKENYLVPSMSGGVKNRKYVEYIYAIDCSNQTFNRTKTMFSVHKWRGRESWMSIVGDPIANEVSNKYCRKRALLPKIERTPQIIKPVQCKSDKGRRGSRSLEIMYKKKYPECR